VTTPHLLHVFSTFVPAGPQVRVAKLLAAFGGEFRHSIVAMDGVTTARELLLPELDVVFLDAPPKAGSFATAVRMRGLLRRERPDLLLTYNFGAIDSVLAARTLGQGRVVHHEDGFLPDEVQGFKRRRIWLRRIALGGAQVVVISRNLERIARELWKLDESRVHFIANGIEVERFATARGNGEHGNPELRAQLGIPRDSIVVGAVGHLRPEKNLPRLLAAVAVAQPAANLHLLLLGDGPERAALTYLRGQLDLNERVDFVGEIRDVETWFARAGLVVHASRREGFPNAVLEAMAMGAPVICTNCRSGPSDIIEDRVNGRLIAVDDVDALAGAMTELIENPRFRLGLAAKALKVRDSFEQNMIMDRWSAVLLGPRATSQRGFD